MNTNMETTPMETTPQDVVLLTLPAAMNRLSISRSSLYELMALGEIVSIKLGRSRRVPSASIDDFVARRVAETVQDSKPEQREMG
jgi:excisionase family DNA binding protein